MWVRSKLAMIIVMVVGLVMLHSTVQAFEDYHLYSWDMTIADFEQEGYMCDNDTCYVPCQQMNRLFETIPILGMEYEFSNKVLVGVKVWYHDSWEPFIKQHLEVDKETKKNFDFSMTTHIPRVRLLQIFKK